MNAKKIGNYAVKVSIFIVLAIAIYQQFFLNKNFSQLTQGFQQSFYLKNMIWLLLAFLFMFFNWGVEALKWQKLMAKIEILKFSAAFRAILCGVSLSLFTPNRVGEYGGRVLILQKANKIQAIGLTLIGSWSQLIIHISLGVLGLYIFELKYFEFNHVFANFLFIGIALLCGLSLFLYFNIHFLEKLTQKLHRYQQWQNYWHIVKQYRRSELTYILLLSLLRYFIFALQYVFLLWFFGVSAPLANILILVCSIFFIQTIVPSIALVELGIRGNVALFFLTYITENSLAILAATFSLWTINLLLPAILGAVVIGGLDIFSSLKMPSFGFWKR